jgi:hypothetical protein
MVKGITLHGQVLPFVLPAISLPFMQRICRPAVIGKVGFADGIDI